MKKRCVWCGDDPLYVAYHDDQWGVPVHDDRLLLEMLILEGAQAGLSWLTILTKRENYRKALHNFDIARIAGYTQRDVRRLLDDPGIVRNRLKIDATIRNANSALAIIEKFGSLDSYFWRYVEGEPIQNHWQSLAEIPTKTRLSDTMARDLKKRGFNFVGSTICQALMEAIGMINDHTIDCYRHQEIQQLSQQNSDR